MFVKLDFSNAFNSVCRDAKQEAVALQAPSLLGYIDSPYGDVTCLKPGEFVVDSAEGIQQGDPLSPLLCFLTIQLLLLNIQSKYVSGYLHDFDDIGVRGEPKMVADDVTRLKQDARAVGLMLNHNTSSEVIGSPEAIAA